MHIGQTLKASRVHTDSQQRNLHVATFLVTIDYSKWTTILHIHFPGIAATGLTEAQNKKPEHLWSLKIIFWRPWLFESPKTKAPNINPLKIYGEEIYGLQWLRTLRVTLNVTNASIWPQRTTKWREEKNRFPTFPFLKFYFWKQGFPTESYQ